MFQILLAIIYLSFISLGLPDGLLGAAWPNMYQSFGVPLSYAGIISSIISIGTVVSSFMSDRLTLRFGTGRITAVSVAMTALALLGFSFSRSFVWLCICAVPYGLGAGSVDASLNNYVALHYESRHMSWLHCMWGVGAAIGPYIMGFALTGGLGWNRGYLIVAVMQIALAAILFISIPLWKTRSAETGSGSSAPRKPLSLIEILRIKGAKEVLICFFCYCAIEQTAGLWASSYLNLHKNIPVDTAASFASMFFIGITAGRAVDGFLTMKLSDTKMIRLGFALTLAGIIIMMLPAPSWLSLAGLIIIGLGCAPVYPCIIHSTPAHFGEDKSQAIIGVQMAFAYLGILVMPPLFGVIANAVGISILPYYLMVILVLMVLSHEALIRATEKSNPD